MFQIYILDDELKAAETLEFLLRHTIADELEIIIQTDAQQAIIDLNHRKPDLLFLDIRMPFKNGFEVLDSIHEPNFEIIFTTAFDQYGVKALEFSALDFLLKPVDQEDLLISFNKFKKRNASKVDFIAQYEILKKLYNS